MYKSLSAVTGGHEARPCEGSVPNDCVSWGLALCPTGSGGNGVLLPDRLGDFTGDRQCAVRLFGFEHHQAIDGGRTIDGGRVCFYAFLEYWDYIDEKSIKT